MKKTILLSLFAILAFVCNAQENAQEKKTSKAVVVLSVEIDCESCINTIQKNIAYEKGVTGLEINKAKQEVTVTYNSKKTNKENLIDAFSKINKPATEVKAIECSKENSTCCSK